MAFPDPTRRRTGKNPIAHPTCLETIHKYLARPMKKTDIAFIQDFRRVKKEEKKITDLSCHRALFDMKKKHMATVQTLKAERGPEEAREEMQAEKWERTREALRDTRFEGFMKDAGDFQKRWGGQIPSKTLEGVDYMRDARPRWERHLQPKKLPEPDDFMKDPAYNPKLTARAKFLKTLKKREKELKAQEEDPGILAAIKAWAEQAGVDFKWLVHGLGEAGLEKMHIAKEINNGMATRGAVQRVAQARQRKREQEEKRREKLRRLSQQQQDGGSEGGTDRSGARPGDFSVLGRGNNGMVLTVSPPPGDIGASQSPSASTGRPMTRSQANRGGAYFVPFSSDPPAVTVPVVPLSKNRRDSQSPPPLRQQPVRSMRTRAAAAAAAAAGMEEASPRGQGGESVGGESVKREGKEKSQQVVLSPRISLLSGVSGMGARMSMGDGGASPASSSSSPLVDLRSRVRLPLPSRSAGSFSNFGDSGGEGDGTTPAFVKREWTFNAAKNVPLLGAEASQKAQLAKQAIQRALSAPPPAPVASAAAAPSAAAARRSLQKREVKREEAAARKREQRAANKEQTRAETQALIQRASAAAAGRSFGPLNRSVTDEDAPLTLVAHPDPIFPTGTLPPFRFSTKNAATAGKDLRRPPLPLGGVASSDGVKRGRGRPPKAEKRGGGPTPPETPTPSPSESQLSVSTAAAAAIAGPEGGVAKRKVGRPAKTLSSVSLATATDGGTEKKRGRPKGSKSGGKKGEKGKTGEGEDIMGGGEETVSKKKKAQKKVSEGGEDFDSEAPAKKTKKTAKQQPNASLSSATGGDEESVGGGMLVEKDKKKRQAAPLSLTPDWLGQFEEMEADSPTSQGQEKKQKQKQQQQPASRGKKRNKESFASRETAKEILEAFSGGFLSGPRGKAEETEGEVAVKEERGAERERVPLDSPASLCSKTPSSGDEGVLTEASPRELSRGVQQEGEGEEDLAEEEAQALYSPPDAESASATFARLMELHRERMASGKTLYTPSILRAFAPQASAGSAPTDGFTKLFRTTSGGTQAAGSAGTKTAAFPTRPPPSVTAAVGAAQAVVGVGLASSNYRVGCGAGPQRAVSGETERGQWTTAPHLPAGSRGPQTQIPSLPFRQTSPPGLYHTSGPSPSGAPSSHPPVMQSHAPLKIPPPAPGLTTGLPPTRGPAYAPPTRPVQQAPVRPGPPPRPPTAGAPAMASRSHASPTSAGFALPPQHQQQPSPPPLPPPP
eukprot:Cvel_1895.t1-p1 / transcript=Cvel_1895.t1 / gene=Cvel_1895 / organism=Chromera_velia_CCMP2878 / gene_product=hypothetical protein / transcript_product=hypothetical protein / location=Cvel_scaffold71:1-5815(-) / protein_length=1235 / sequence_SO=supercontig / SO=protein_coding / is_pseudo=false